MSRALAPVLLGLLASASACSAKDKFLDHVNALDFEMHLEKLDTASGTFTEKAPPINKRLAMAVASKGKLYFIGGIKGSTQYVDFVEIYDPASNTWTAGAAWPNPRFAYPFESDGLICMVAGLKDVTEVPDVECYNTATNGWSKRKPYPTGAGKLNLAQSGAKIYALGSETGGIGSRTQHAEGFVYDTLADTWTSIAPSPEPCQPKGIGAVGDSAYLLGCPQPKDAPKPGAQTKIYQYVIPTDTWKALPDAIPDELWNAAVVVDKEILMYSTLNYPTIHRLHHTTKTIQTASPPPTPFAIASASPAYAYKNDFYLLVHSEARVGASGKKETVITGRVWKYSIVTDTWTKAAEHRQDQRATTLTPAVIGDDVFFVGGYTTTELSFH